MDNVTIIRLITEEKGEYSLGNSVVSLIMGKPSIVSTEQNYGKLLIHEGVCPQRLIRVSYTNILVINTAEGKTINITVLPKAPISINGGV